MKVDGVVLLLLIATIFIVAAVAIKLIKRRIRRARLLTKYGDAAVVDAIMEQKIWQGMSAEQLLESWGRPEDVDQKTLKSKVALTCKYGQTGKNRFSSRVHLENDVVVGWEQK